MSDDIYVEEDANPETQEIVIQSAKASGWLAWYSPQTNSPQSWMQIVPPFDPSYNRDIFRCPYPLFREREEALDAGKKALYAGGKIKLIKVVL